MQLYNTRTRKIEEFKPLQSNTVGLYTCGPTVYHYAHIGNLRTYVFEDILRRALAGNGWAVNHVMNITDVGHLTSDADDGEDKMQKGAIREGKTAWQVAEFYTAAFLNDAHDLNLLPPTTLCKATDHIAEQIALVQILTDKGFTYETVDGIYFDTTKDPNYGALANLQNQTLQAGARVEMGEKKNPHDFALWKWSEPQRTSNNEQMTSGKRDMEWPFELKNGLPIVAIKAKMGLPIEVLMTKMGFPGWHIECSAMALKYLGEQFDIHCGGIDHIPVHHTNEIAQTENATEVRPWVNFWLHGEFLLVDNDNKMSKSGDNFITLQTLKTKNIDPLSYRYFLLQAHYRKQLAFSFEALEAAQTGFKRLKKSTQGLKLSGKMIETEKFYIQFLSIINDDLNTAAGLALLQTAINDQTIDQKTVERCDKILGLDLLKTEAEIIIPENVQILLDQRQEMREQKNWAESDRLRAEIQKLGFEVEDTIDGQKII